MRSLRTCITLTTVVAVALTLGACSDRLTNPLRADGPQPGSASHDGKVGNTGNAAKDGAIDVRVLLDKTQHALLVVHTGTFNDETITGTPNGYFQSLQYKVYNASGRQVQVENVRFAQTGVTRYLTPIDLCSHSGDKDDADAESTSCNMQFGAGWTVSVQANLKSVAGDDKEIAVVRANSIVEYLPDIDMTQQGMFVVGPGGSQAPASIVTPSVATTFSVAIPNNKTIAGQANAVGVIASCLVTVDGTLQIAVPNSSPNQLTNPNAFGYIGNQTQTIAAGAIGVCQFTLTLSAGTHHVSVTAVALYPGDYDVGNNTTNTVTVNAVAGPPDIAVGVLQQDLGTRKVPLGSVAVIAGPAAVTLDQWVSLVSGAPTGPVTCTLTLSNTTLGSASQTVTGLAPSSTSACVMSVTFPTAGVYSIVSTVAAPSDVQDPNLGNNTSTTALVVARGVPSASVTAGSIAFKDGVTGVSGNLEPIASPGDTVHVGDLVTYTAGINVTSLVNTNAVDVACKVLDGTTDITNSVTWITGPTLTAAPAGQQNCVFKLALDEPGTNSRDHSISVSVTTPAATNTATGSTTVTGVITDQVRIDVSAQPLNRIGDGVSATNVVPLDTTKETNTITINTVIQNPTTHPTTVDCTVSADPTLQPTPVGMVTAVPVTANGSASCRFSLTPTTLGAFTVAIRVTPSAGALPDPNMTNNVGSGTLTVMSLGKFTSISLSGIDLNQQWYNLAGLPALPPDSLVVQHVVVTQLALVVVPTTAILGKFTLTGQVVDGTTTFPAGGVSGTLYASSGGVSCSGLTAGPNASFPNAPVGFPSQIGYYSSICSAPATVNGVGGFQQVSINYTQSLNGSIPTVPAAYFFTGTVQVKITLGFTLAGSTTPDQVTATVNIAVPAPSGGRVLTTDGTRVLWTETNPAPAVVTSP